MTPGTATGRFSSPSIDISIMSMMRSPTPSSTTVGAVRLVKDGTDPFAHSATTPAHGDARLVGIAGSTRRIGTETWKPATTKGGRLEEQGKTQFQPNHDSRFVDRTGRTW